MPQRSCDTCGNTYQAKQARSRFCSDVCRAKNNGKPAGAHLVSVPTGEDDLTRTTREALEAAKRLDTPMGQAVLALAVSIGSESGSAKAALVREFRATLSEALDGAGAKADPLDLLAQRRDLKRA